MADSPPVDTSRIEVADEYLRSEVDKKTGKHRRVVNRAATLRAARARAEEGQEVLDTVDGASIHLQPGYVLRCRVHGGHADAASYHSFRVVRVDRDIDTVYGVRATIEEVPSWMSYGLVDVPGGHD